MKKIFTATAILIIVATLFTMLLVDYPSQKAETLYVGVTYCGNSVEEGKILIDRVKSYTNLFVLQSGFLQRDLKSVNELGDYAVSAGLYFIPYFGRYIPPSFASWLDSAKQRWKEHFLGVYYDDEPGGKMLDDYVEFKNVTTGDEIMKTRYGDIVVKKSNGVVIHYEISGVIHLYQPANENLSANESANKETDVYTTFYPNGTINVAGAYALTTTGDQLANWPSEITYEYLLGLRPFKDINEAAERFDTHYDNSIEYLKSNSTKVFTSDYVLHWFDYLAGYDVVLAQIGWNNTFAQQIGLVRGAAKLQNKEWGIIITWKYDKLPYLDSGPEILNQMQTAYECGAKYIVLFNYYEHDNNPYGTMNEEHFLALENFWTDVLKNPEIIHGSIEAEAVLVLPKNYGWGMRWQEDKIWGVFESDEESKQIWGSLQKALRIEGLNLDIVYADSDFPVAGKYQQVYDWAQTG